MARVGTCLEDSICRTLHRCLGRVLGAVVLGTNRVGSLKVARVLLRDDVTAAAKLGWRGRIC